MRRYCVPNRAETLNTKKNNNEILAPLVVHCDPIDDDLPDWLQDDDDLPDWLAEGAEEFEAWLAEAEAEIPAWLDADVPDWLREPWDEDEKNEAVRPNPHPNPAPPLVTRTWEQGVVPSPKFGGGLGRGLSFDDDLPDWLQDTAEAERAILADMVQRELRGKEAV